MPTPFRILDNRPIYWDTLGDRPAAGGRLDFFLAGTLTPKKVFEGPSLSVSNGVSVTLDSAGRTEVDTWGDGGYKVRLYNAAGELVSEADNVQVAGGAVVIPPVEDGKFLSGVGGLAVWASILQVPDPTGQNGKALFSNGVSAIWQALATVTANCQVTFPAGGIKFSDGTNARMIQYGTASVPASGTGSATTSVNFATPFTSTPVVLAWPTTRSNAAPIVMEGNGGFGTTGFSVIVDPAEGGGGGGTVALPVPFNYIAIGTVAP